MSSQQEDRSLRGLVKEVLNDDVFVGQTIVFFVLTLFLGHYLLTKQRLEKTIRTLSECQILHDDPRLQLKTESQT
jgi:hypothetical protein